MERSAYQERIRRRLWEALKALLETTDIRQIRVQDICARADVHRSTFYRHFHDIYELVDYGVELLFSDLNEARPEPCSTQEFVLEIVGQVTQYRALYLHLQNTAYRDEILRSIDRVLEKQAGAVVERYVLPAHPQVPAEVLTRFYLGGIRAAVDHYIYHGEIPAAQMRAELTALLRFLPRSFSAAPPPDPLE